MVETMEDSVLILGERFEFRESESLRVDFDAKVIEFDPGNRSHIKRLERVLKRRLLLELEPAVKGYSERLGAGFKRIVVKRQRSRWGSCSSNGNLNFNLGLVCLPRELIRYVAFHEVAHLKEGNHSRAFWALVRGEFEDYKAIKKKLSEYGPLTRRASPLPCSGRA